MSKLLMCGVSAYLFFSGLVWWPVCGGIVVLITFWDYFSEVAGELAEDYAATRTRRRLRSGLHTPVHPYWTLRAFESRGARMNARDLDNDQSLAFPILSLGSLCRAGFLAVRSVLTLE
ncbi:MAG TPA: hypothetical protein VEN79_16115 [Terriglobia bacterium]|nr:hypothetical protein [Terriglobia bacterium]